MTRVDEMNLYFDVRQTFQELRLARGYTQEDISDETVSRSLISKFESGKSMLSADKLLHAIRHLNMTPNEFVNILTHYRPDRMQELYDTLTQIRFSGPQGINLAMKLIIPETRDKFQRLSNIMIKSVIQHVTGKTYVLDDEKIMVGNYLNGIENWTTFEVNLFFYTCPILDIGDINWFGELLLGQTQYFYSGANKPLFLNTLIRVYDCMLIHQEIDYAEFFRAKIKGFDFVADLNLTIKFQILSHLHDYIRDSTAENLSKASAYLEKVAALGIAPIISYCQDRLDKVSK
ncbi:helix-turn-helix domain-containing protein [Lactococcus piscium]|uniref:helix-turn-helix domain-containing protein n=1 Tax=Pseudolactococcus carnosus TaxID=2749961 RepID=UPI001FBA4120|nr:Rgg/GadR/MutR family transcriptional regulator [Lactococcus carnosus]MCJ1995948.1 helix-turn-helix domain-containing protein [Lactococcus carnosus]